MKEVIFEKKRKPFQPMSKDWNFYRDLALLWPLILTVFLAGAELFNRAARTRLKVVLISVALVLFLLAHEKKLLLGGIAACFSLYSIYAFIRYHYLPAILVFAVAGTVWFLIFKLSQNRRPSYEWPSELGGFEALVCLASMMATFAGWYLLNR